MFAAVSAAGLVSFTVPAADSSIAHKPDTRDIALGEPTTGVPVSPPFQRSVVQAIVVEAENTPAISRDA